MSAMVLGKRNSSRFFDELNHHPAAGATITPPPLSVSKKARFHSSPSCLPPQSSPSSAPGVFLSPPSDCMIGVIRNNGAGDSLTSFEHLRSAFPETDEQVIVKELEACSDDVDSAIKNLEKFCCRSRNEELDSADGSEWVERLVSEMMKATDITDARVRASSMLKALEKFILTHVSIKASESIEKESMILKEQVEGLLRDNNILKRAVAIQHERQKELQMKTPQGNQEIQHLRQLVSQYQQQIQTLEINNYSLSMHLRQAQQDNSMPTRFHPDVF